MAQYVLLCPQHQREYSDSRERYRAHARRAQVLGASTSMSRRDLGRTQDLEQLEVQLGIVTEYIAELSGEIDGRIQHRDRYFIDG